MVYGQAIGGFNVAADDDEHIGAVQRGPHDAGRLLVPVGPEHETEVVAMIIINEVELQKCLQLMLTQIKETFPFSNKEKER